MNYWVTERYGPAHWRGGELKLLKRTIFGREFSDGFNTSIIMEEMVIG